MQLTLGTPSNVGHHWRTKCALSGNQGGEGNGLSALACVEDGEGRVGGFIMGDPLTFCGTT